ncbi:putative uncharacterized oxidoreductase, partial [Lachnellula occidentalis]
MAGELVFITGATGFIGFAVLHQALESGYRVRISIRKEPQIQTLSSHPLIAPFVTQGKVSFAIVPDITVAGAFDEVLKDVVYVEHLAAALPGPVSLLPFLFILSEKAPGGSHANKGIKTDNPEQDIVQPAIHGTTSILTSALLHASIKRIVITSSIAAILSSTAQSASTPTTYTSTSRVSPLPTGPWPNGIEAYRGAKALALDATDRFVAEKKPRFSIVNVMPGYVIGRNALAMSARELQSGSNNVVLGLVTGNVRKEAQLATVVDVRDVARVQVEALDGRKV